MKDVAHWLKKAALCAITVGTVYAHEVSYEGVVASIRPNRHAAASGVIARLEVELSGRRKPGVFDITVKTKLLRGNTPVSLAEAHIRQGEAVVVIVNHDEPHEGALEVRLMTQN